MLELLSPAGEYESAEAAFTFGADAVYLSDKQFGMRTSSKNFSAEEIEQVVNLAKNKNGKVYVTVNVLPFNEEIEALNSYIPALAEVGVDAVIVADVGVLGLAKKLAPNLAVHISTQAGVTNYLTTNELCRLGASRVVLARELSLADIKNIRKKVSDELELEAFVHGSMCMSFSGRCFLSQYLSSKDANHGACTQPCRWKYKAYLEEEKRPGMLIPIVESQTGTTILNAQDLCMIDHLDDIVECGVNTIKIEGRAKSAYYTAVVTGAYRSALSYLEKSEKLPEWVKNELNKVSHRPYSTGFYYAGLACSPNRIPPSQTYNRDYIQQTTVLGDIFNIDIESIKEFSFNLVVQIRNKIAPDMEAEILLPNTVPIKIKIKNITNEYGHQLPVANVPMEKVSVVVEVIDHPSENIVQTIKSDQFLRRGLLRTTDLKQ